MWRVRILDLRRPAVGVLSAARGHDAFWETRYSARDPTMPRRRMPSATCRDRA